MKRLFLMLGFILIALAACGQIDQTFEKPAMFRQGFYFGDSTYMNTAATGSGPVNWIDIQGKPSSYPPASHEHALLYKPISYMPAWVEITGKPLTYPATAHTHLWTEVTSKPTEVELINELPQMAYLPLPQKTTAEINSMVIPSGTIAMVWDKTLAVVKVWNGSQWKIMITNQ